MSLPLLAGNLSNYSLSLSSFRLAETRWNASSKLFAIAWWFLITAFACAQCPSAPNGCSQAVPHLLKFNGTLRDPAVKPRTGVVGISFSIYADASGGTPLWQETQNVQPDAQGRYTVLLGSSTSEGVPIDLFKSGEPRWIAWQILLPGEQEQLRVLMVSVPYALRAADAETLGGFPPSAFVRVPSGASAPESPAGVVVVQKSASQTSVAVGAAVTAAAEIPVTTSGGSPNTIPKFSVNPSISNSQITDVNGVVSLQNLANIFFADQFPDGVPGALAACPAEGCTIYAAAQSVNRNLGTIDPGSKHVTIYLGPFTYNVKQITLRTGFRMIGMGASATTLQSVNGNSSVFVLPSVNNVTSQHVLLSGLGISGSVGNTSEDAFFLDSSTASNIGLWYSEFNDLQIANFAGIGIHLRGPNLNFGSETQWVIFNNVVVFRTAGGGNALRIEGANFQLHFNDCEFDGTGIGDGTNIYIGGYPGGSFSFPFDITFRGLVTQSAAVGVQIDGGQTITFQTSHHESLWGAYLITGNSGVYNRDISITDSAFNPNVGVNNGAGYLVNVATTLAQGIYFSHNRLGGFLGASAPDSVVTATNLSQVVYQDNEYFGTSNVPPTAGITTQLPVAATINIGGTHTIGIAPDPAATPITTIQSTLGPGETVTFAALGGSIVFATGGNIALPGATKVTVTGTITFVRNDLTGTRSQWWPVSQWSATSAMGTPPSFSLTTSPPSSQTVNAGDTATYNLNLIPSGGFLGAVRFTCVGFPKESTCSVSPNPLTVAGSSPASASVSVMTRAPIPTLKNSLTPWQNDPGQRDLPAGGMLTLIPLGILGTRRKGSQRKRILLAGLVALTALCVGCGASASSTGQGDPTFPFTGTPSGTYVLVVTGVSDSNHTSTTLVLNVL